MGDIERLFCDVVGTEQQTILNSINGVIAKGIMVSNLGSSAKTLKLNVDGAEFVFPVEANNTIILNNVLACNVVKASVIAADGEASDNNLSVNITGLRLGVA